MTVSSLLRRSRASAIAWAPLGATARISSVRARAAENKLSSACAPRKCFSACDSTIAALRRWREIQNREREFFANDYHPGDYVFTFADGRPPHPDTIRQRFDRLAAAAGLSRITFHDLRDSYATGALKAGISPKVISERIGHANVGFFLQTYAHVLRNGDRDAAEQAAAFLIGNSWDPAEESAASD
jgi:site-specific recombinase XerC